MTFSCRECGKKFADLEAAAGHKCVHKIKCPTCKAEYTSKREKPLRCRVCGALLNRKTPILPPRTCKRCGATVKSMVHRPVQCSRCGFRFRYGSGKEGRRVYLATGEFVLLPKRKCPHCGGTWQPKNPDPFRCPLCTKRLRDEKPEEIERRNRLDRRRRAMRKGVQA